MMMYVYIYTHSVTRIFLTICIYIYMCVHTYTLFVTLMKVYDQNVVNKYEYIFYLVL